PVPRLAREVAPRYPIGAFRRKIEGSVSVQFTIRPDGSVADVTLTGSTPEGVFDRAALSAVQQWRFDPPGESMLIRRTLNFSIATAAPG
ncbi:MAG: energy transducer TonB, partial [Pseudomonadota bacterium]|nr:energy transducer TonB [Pseudomonadota bacterium]